MPPFFILILALCCAASWLICRCIIRYALPLKLVQVPNHRSSHSIPTPGGGGIGIVLVASAAGLYLAPSFAPVLILAFILALIGLLDDIRTVPAQIRFVLQFVIVTAILLITGPLPLWHVVLLIPIIIAGVWWINLFNFMDGIDGIAGSQVIFMLGSAAGLSALAFPVLNHPAWILMMLIIAATTGFLMLNWAPAKVFMGDAGSTWLALMVFSLGLITVSEGWLQYGCLIVLATLFVTDATVTLTTRMLRRESWTQAHRSHAYQRLSRKFVGHNKEGHHKVTLITLGCNFFWILPLATACQIWPALQFLWIAIAYIPIVMMTVIIGAGKPDHA